MATRLERKIERFNDMVDRINEQIRKIEDADPDSVVLERYKGLYGHIDNPNVNERTFNELYKEVKDLVKGDRLSLASIERSKAETINTLKEMGINYVNGRNFNSFMRFMDDARARHLGSIYTSEQLIEAIREAKKRGLTKAQIRANMDRWARKAVKFDRQGKMIEVIEPPKLNVIRSKRRNRKA